MNGRSLPAHSIPKALGHQPTSFGAPQAWPLPPKFFNKQHYLCTHTVECWIVDQPSSILEAHAPCARRRPLRVRRRHHPCHQKLSNSNALLSCDRSQTVDGRSKQLHASSAQALCQAHAWLGAPQAWPLLPKIFELKYFAFARPQSNGRWSIETTPY